MFFVVSKLIEDLLLPSNAIGAIAALGLLLLLLRRRKAARILLVTAAALLLVMGALPAGKAALLVLENRFPQPVLPEAAAGIVVLGGAVDTHLSAERDTVALNDGGERITAAAVLAERFPDARIILSGGLGHLFAGRGKTESAYARDLLVQMGVAVERIELEERSRNTCENASESKAVARPKAEETWLLVTSAAHMPRAVACFNAVGFPVLPFPVDYRTRPSDLRQLPKSVAEGLVAADLAMHEWLGLVAYHLIKGTEFFPAKARQFARSPD
jgi:uncharacterized SAM-binding protein YcdF (DUF218 family)